MFWFSVNAIDWTEIKMSDRFSRYEIIDIAYFNSKFFMLLKDGDRFAISFTANGSSINYYDLAWQKTIPCAIAGGSDQLVVVGTEGISNTLSVLYTEIGESSNSWIKTTFDAPVRNQSLSESTLNDVLYVNGTWYVVGTIDEWNASKSMKFSHTGLVYKHRGSISSSSNFEPSDIQSSDCRRIYVYENQIFVNGSSHPQPDNCIFVEVSE
jgi:hypothetical protein